MIINKRAMIASISAVAMLLSSCGGGGTGSGGGTVTIPTPTPTPTPTSTACSLSSRQSFALRSLNEWYLFPGDLNTAANPASFTNLPDYVDALTAPARASNKDRFFTYVTSINEENAFFSSGASAGFGVRLGMNGANRLFISEAFEGAPALAAGIDRGTEIVGIGNDVSSIRTVTDIIATSGSQGLTDALGPSTPGTARALRVIDPGTTTPRTVTVTKADYSLTPVSNRYGTRIIDDSGRKIGYINLRTFISSADAPLRSAFASFRAAGVTQIIVDFRYNGGGLVSIADVMGDLMGQGRSGQTWSQLLYRSEKSSSNTRHNFAPTGDSIAPTRIAFIGMGGTASASELVMFAALPYLGNNVALVGSNTYGKPVGQIALDLAACDDRLRVVSFGLANASGAANYYNGIAPVMPNSCAASDDVTFPLGDPREASIRTAIDFLNGRACTPITAGSSSGAAQAGLGGAKPTSQMQLLSPTDPSAAQHQVPGMF
jgi:carboxyl-terminal processing protease